MMSRHSSSRQALFAQIRLLLGQFGEVFAADASALLAYDEKSRVLGVACRFPAGSRRRVVRTLSSSCALTSAFGRARNNKPTSCEECGVCRNLFGAPPVASFPITLAQGQRQVVAAFRSGPPASEASLRKARRLVEHLRTFLNYSHTAQQAERRAVELAAINEIARNLTSVLDLDVLFPNILAEIDRVIHTDYANLRLFDLEAREFRLVATRNLTPEQIGLAEEAGAWNRMAAAVFQSQQPATLRNLLPYMTEAYTPTQLPVVADLRSALWVPIVFRGESLGVIGLASKDPVAFDAEQQELVVSLANHAAIAIANARLYHEVDVHLQSKLRHLGTLSGIGNAMVSSLQLDTVLQTIADGTVAAFGSGGSAIVLLSNRDEELIIAAGSGVGAGQKGRRLPIAGSASGWVVCHGEPLVVPQVRDTHYQPLGSWYERGIRGFASVPLFAKGKAIGCLNVYMRSRQGLVERDVVLLQDIANQAGIAIEHARLYESVAREKARIEAIVESLQEGLVLVNRGRVVDFTNRRFVELLDLNDRAVVGESIDRIWDWLIERCQLPGEAKARLESLNSAAPDPALLTLARPFNRDLEIHTLTVKATDGGLLGKGYLVRDVTHQAEVERLKASILATVSHELRTPLAAIKGFATSLLRDDVEWDHASKIDFIEQIEREADRLSGLVRNLLDMSQLEARTLRFEPECCDLSELVSDVMLRMAPIVARHDVSLVGTNTNVLAYVDRRYIERVVWNLVENAVKYSPPGSTIEVAVARKDRMAVLLTVADQGIGIRPDERTHIFEPFYRSRNGPRVAGAGLGLAICRGMIEAHGGTITCETTRELGTVFSVRLPRRVRGGLRETAANLGR